MSGRSEKSADAKLVQMPDKKPAFDKSGSQTLRTSKWHDTKPRLREVLADNSEEDQKPKIAELISKMRVPGDEGCNASTELIEIGKLAVPLLIVALRDPDYKVQVRAAHALGKIGDLSAVPALLEAIGGKHPNSSKTPAEMLVWESAALALRRIVNGK